MPVGAAVASRAGHAGDRPALSTADRALSRAQLERLVVRRAARLAAGRTEQAATAVGLVVSSGAQLLICMLAACRSGRPAMVLDPDWPRAHLERTLELIPPGRLITDQQGRGKLGVSGPPVGLARAGADRPTDDRPFYIGFTSGTTARPKAYLRSHASWLASFGAWSEVVHTGCDDEVLVAGRLHSSLFLFAALHGLHTGAHVHLLDGWDARAAAEVLGRDHVTVLHVVPAMLSSLIGHLEQNRGARRRAAAGLRTVVCAGSPLAEEPVRRLGRLLPGVRLVEYYGASELSFVAWRELGPDRPGFTVFPEVDVELRGRTVHVRSPYLFDGYLGSPDGDGPAAVRLDDPRDEEGFVTVGDHGRWRDDGTLQLLGRAGRLHCGGQRLDVAAVEAALQTAPEVEDVMVVSFEHPRLGQLPAALIVPTDEDPPRRRLRRHAAEQLRREHLPRAWYAVSRLPPSADRPGVRGSWGRRLDAGLLDATALP